MGDICQKAYGLNGRAFGGVFGFMYVLGLYVMQLLAMARIFETMTGLPLSASIIICSAIMIGYTWAGGILAVILTDALQFVILTMGLTICLVLILIDFGGLNALWSAVNALPDIGTKMSFTADWTTGALITFIFTYAIGEFLAPYYIQRYATAKDARQARISAVAFAVFFGIFAVSIPSVLGYASLVLNPDVGKDLALTTLIRDTMPIGLKGLLFGGLLAAVMSSGDSFLNNAALAYAKDVHGVWINKKITKYATLFMGISSILIALSYPDIFGLMVRVYYYWAPTMIVPLLVAIFAKDKIAPISGPIGMLFGIATALVWEIAFDNPLGLHYAIAGIIANILAMLISNQIFKIKPLTT